MKHGEVMKVHSNDEGVVMASVTVTRSQVTYHKCTLLNSFGGAVQSIEAGVQVAIDRTDDGLWMIVGVLGRDGDRLPKVEDQERVMSFDDGTEISVRQDGDGNHDISITASGDTTLDANGDILFGSDVETEPDGAGLRVTTPDGTDEYRIRVDDSGAVTTDGPLTE